MLSVFQPTTADSPIVPLSSSLTTVGSLGRNAEAPSVNEELSAVKDVEKTYMVILP